ATTKVRKLKRNADRRRRRDSNRALEMDLLIRDILFTYFRLNAIGGQLFGEIGVTPGQVSLMRSLMEEGPQSVSQIARARPVARQGVQRMADELAASDLIEFIENPSHRTARLARLTSNGEKLIKQTIAGELQWAEKLARYFDDHDLAVARKVVR